MRKNSLFLLCIILAGTACAQQQADLLVINATIYTVDGNFTKATALAVKDGRIMATGSSVEIQKMYKAKETLDAGGKFIYPGLIDAHAHFFGYAMGLQTADLVGTTSWEQILDKLKDFSKVHTEWIVGRGWDQNDWANKDFPTNEKLTALFPNQPVFLSRVDGHAAIVNQKAIEIAGLKAGDKLEGGDLETKDGKLTGILIDNAVDLVSAKIPGPSLAKMKESLKVAEQNCFGVGLTTIDDCGLDFEQVMLLQNLQKNGQLKMRFYVMLSDSKKNYNYLFANGKVKTERLNVRSFKVYADGALGSRGACLLQPYADKPGWGGFLLSSQAHFDSVAKVIAGGGFQMCTHAIGDSGNRTILNIYAKYLKGKNDLRWRIEHAQVVNENDFSIFGANSIVPSVQPTHATSDMYWAGDRLGPGRVKVAYAFKRLLDENKWIPLGTDFPVEDISPFKTFYAAVIRKDAKGWPAGGYQVENALSREDALRGMTIWAAKANFEEQEKGSLEKGKFADFIITDTDLMTAAPEKLLQTKVLKTFVSGEKVFDMSTKKINE